MTIRVPGPYTRPLRNPDYKPPRLSAKERGAALVHQRQQKAKMKAAGKAAREQLQAIRFSNRRYT